jgi:hypothetical protein
MQKPGDGNTATLNIEALLHSETYCTACGDAANAVSLTCVNNAHRFGET